MERQNDMYFTMWYGVYHRGKRLLKYARGGHPDPLLVAGRPPCTGMRLTARNPMVGVSADVAFQGAQVELPAASRLYVFSDGVYEVSTPEGEMWGCEALQDFIERSTVSGEQVLEDVWRQVVTLNGSESLPDDLSILELEIA